jgi:hypothetical protein
MKAMSSSGLMNKMPMSTNDKKWPKPERRESLAFRNVKGQ